METILWELHKYYGSHASNKLQKGFTKSDRLYWNVHLMFYNKNLVGSKLMTINKIKKGNSKRYSFTKSKLELKKGDK